MNDKTEEMIKQVYEGRSVLATFEKRKQQIMIKPAGDRTTREQGLVDWFSMSHEEMWDARLNDYKDRISPEQLGKLLGLGRKTIRTLPLKHSMPFVRTPSGFRQALRFSRDEVLTFLASLNPSFIDFDIDEPLLKPDQAVELCQECGANMNTRLLGVLRREGSGPDYIQFNSRVCRYRIRDVLNWIKDPKPKSKPLATSELIMRGIDHGD